MAKIVLDIQGMSCQHCKMRIEKTLARVTGVESATVNLAEGKADVSGTPDVNALIAQIKQLGYQASLAS
jgi:copper chaperone